jgi:hypothetical protein
MLAVRGAYTVISRAGVGRQKHTILPGDASPARCLCAMERAVAHVGRNSIISRINAVVNTGEEGRTEDISATRT